MGFTDRFISWGQRAFSVHTAWQRVAFQPILYLFLWSAAVRITFTDSLPPIQFSRLLTPYGETVWSITALICPPLSLLAWWLMTHCRWSRSTLASMWLRFGADVGQFAVVAIYHVVAILTATGTLREETLYARYAVASIMAFQLGVIMRDVWALIMVERIAADIRR